MHAAKSLDWRVSPVLPIAKIVGAVSMVALAYAFGRTDPVRWVLAGVVALVLTGWALRDVIAPVRLAADETGLVLLTGFARRRHLPWTSVQHVRVDRREHRGLRNALLEIDSDAGLHLLSTYDLGTPVDEVADALATLRPPG